MEGSDSGWHAMEVVYVLIALAGSLLTRPIVCPPCGEGETMWAGRAVMSSELDREAGSCGGLICMDSTYMAPNRVLLVLRSVFDMPFMCVVLEINSDEIRMYSRVLLAERMRNKQQLSERFYRGLGSSGPRTPRKRSSSRFSCSRPACCTAPDPPARASWPVCTYVCC